MNLRLPTRINATKLFKYLMRIQLLLFAFFAILPLSADHGLSGHEIIALASDPERRWVS